LVATEDRQKKNVGHDILSDLGCFRGSGGVKGQSLIVEANPEEEKRRMRWIKRQEGDKIEKK